MRLGPQDKPWNRAICRRLACDQRFTNHCAAVLRSPTRASNVVADLRSSSIQQRSFWTLEVPSHGPRDLFTDIDLYPTPLKFDRRAVGARRQQITQDEDCGQDGNENDSYWIFGGCCAGLPDSRRHHAEDHCILSLFDG